MKTLDALYYCNANGPGKRSSLMSVTIRDKFCGAPMRQQHVPRTRLRDLTHRCTRFYTILHRGVTISRAKYREIEKYASSEVQGSMCSISAYGKRI